MYQIIHMQHNDSYLAKGKRDLIIDIRPFGKTVEIPVGIVRENIINICIYYNKDNARKVIEQYYFDNTVYLELRLVLYFINQFFFPLFIVRKTSVEIQLEMH